MPQIENRESTERLREIGQNLVELGDNLLHELEIWTRHPAKWHKQTEKEYHRHRNFRYELDRGVWRWYVTAGGFLWKVLDIAGDRLDGRFRNIVGSFKGERHNPDWAKARSFLSLCRRWLKSAPGGFDFQWESKGSIPGKIEAKAMRVIGQYLIDLSE